MKSTALFLVFIPLLFPHTVRSQFSKNVEQSYLLYNKARLLDATGYTDSAVNYMKKAIQLNNQNALEREFAWTVFIKAGEYHVAIEDIKNYYLKNTLPDKTEDVFYFFDSTMLANAHKDHEVQEFFAAYDGLKKTNKQTVKTDNELKKILSDAMAIDQFARTYPLNKKSTKSDTGFANKLIEYADSSNMAKVAAYIREKGFPSSVESDGVTLSSNFILSFIHYLQDSERYAAFPAWKFLDSSMQQAVYRGTFPASYYLRILDKRFFATSYAKDRVVQQLYGIWTGSTFDKETKKRIRVYGPDIYDIEHVDERRHKWLEPTLYEESLIDPEIRLPEKYHHK